MRRVPLAPAGRWSRFRGGGDDAGGGTRSEAPLSSGPEAEIGEREAEFAARQLLARYGVVFRRLLERERIPVSWRELVRVYRLEELRGEVRGGRFVQRFSGEQYALPEAVELMRRLRRRGADSRGRTEPGPEMALRDGGIRFHALRVAAADPLNLGGILTPGPRVPAPARKRVLVA